MFEFVAIAIAASPVIWLMRRRARQRAEGAAQGDTIKVPCLARQPAHDNGWTRGRMVIGTSVLEWERRGRGAFSALPSGLRQVGVRSPSWREGIRFNGGARIVECTSDDGELWIAVMPNELELVTAALGRAG